MHDDAVAWPVIFATIAVENHFKLYESQATSVEELTWKTKLKTCKLVSRKWRK